MINQVTIYHNPLITRTAQTGSGRFRRLRDKTGNNPPGKLPETRPINFILMHAYARNCMAYVLT